MPKTATPATERRRLCMSYQEFLAWADEDVHAEWVDGELIVHMPPKEWHQAIVSFLDALPRTYVEFFGLGACWWVPSR